MEMRVESDLIRQQRRKRAWSQQHLATVCGLGLRTVQRVERDGTASYDTIQALASAFELSLSDIMKPTRALKLRTSIKLAASYANIMRMPAFLIGTVMVAVLAIGFLRPITQVSPTSSRSDSWAENLSPISIEQTAENGGSEVREPNQGDSNEPTELEGNIASEAVQSPANAAPTAIDGMFSFDQAQETFELQSIDSASMSSVSTYADLRVECRETACKVHIEYSNDPELNEKQTHFIMAERIRYRAAFGFGDVRWKFSKATLPSDPFVAELYFFGEREVLASALKRDPLRVL